MTIPPNIQKQIEEVANKKAEKLALQINLHCKEYRLAILKEALTEITQPLLERIAELEKDLNQALTSAASKQGRIEQIQEKTDHAYTQLQSQLFQMKQAGDRMAEFFYQTKTGNNEAHEAITNWREVTKEVV